MKAIILLLLFVSCQRAEISQHQEGLRESKHFSYGDDAPIETLHAAINNTKDRVPDQLKFMGHQITKKQYSKVLTYLENCGGTSDLFSQIIQNKFQRYVVYGKKKWGEILLTSYYEPIIKGSYKQSPEFSTPLYRPPENIVEIVLKNFEKEDYGISHGSRRLIAAQIDHSGHLPKIIPLPSREEIDYDGALKGKNLEIIYTDIIDAFFLQIQGSGIIQFKDGKKVRLGYAAQNGRKYEAIGKFLLNKIPKDEMSMQRIEEELRQMNKEELRDILTRNPSYVFFREIEGAAQTTLLTDVTPKRTLAVDRKFFPLGIIGHLKYPKMTKEGDSLSISTDETTEHFVINQDTGGAIKGPGRADLYWGQGDEAEFFAGHMRHKAELSYFSPKKSFIKELETKVTCF